MKGPHKPAIAQQLHSFRALELEDTLAMLAGLGVDYVERFDPQIHAPEDTRAVLDKHGLSMPMADVSLDRIGAGRTG